MIRLQIPAAVLRNQRTDALMILQLGAYANAVHTQVRRMLDLAPGELGEERDRVHLFLTSVGYFKEAIDYVQLVQPRLRQLLNVVKRERPELARSVPKWSKLAPVLTNVAGGLYDRAVRTMRHDVSFHFADGVFEKWLDSLSDDEKVPLYEFDKDNRARYYRASTAALELTISATDPALTRELITEIGLAQVQLLGVVELASLGMLIAAGLEPADYFVVS